LRWRRLGRRQRVVGASVSTTTHEAFRWTAETGAIRLGQFMTAEDVSADGSTVVGHTAREGFSGSADSGTALPGADLSTASGVSADGSVVAGDLSADDAIRERPFLWTAEDGIQNLTQLLETFGMDLTGWLPWWLSGGDSGVRVSDDGRTIAGTGLNPQGNLEAWLARIPLSDELESLATGADRNAILLGGAAVAGGLDVTLGEALSAGAGSAWRAWSTSPPTRSRSRRRASRRSRWA
jgi:hypothetical protein